MYLHACVFESAAGVSFLALNDSLTFRCVAGSRNVLHTDISVCGRRLPLLAPSNSFTFQHAASNNKNNNNDNLYSAVTLPNPKAKALYMILVIVRLIKQQCVKPFLKYVD